MPEKEKEKEREKRKLTEEIRRLQGRVADMEESIRVRHWKDEAVSKVLRISPIAMVVSKLDNGTLIDVNDGFLELFGFSREEAIGRTSCELNMWVDPDHRKDIVRRISSGVSIRREHVQYITKDGKKRETLVSSEVIEVEGQKYLGSLIEDISEQRKTEDKLRAEEAGLRLAIEILRILNRSGERMELVSDILRRIKEFTGLEAVGIRLREGEDFPYFEQIGFPASFIEAERYLCERDLEGMIVRGARGNPVLECMCGNVILGRTDPSKPFFTAGGSFWTNCTSDLLASTTEKDRGARTRNRCNGEGYESVALIPLRSGDEIIGLLQLNDKRKNRYSSEMITFFEGVGASVGVALKRMQIEEKLKESHRLELIGRIASGVAHEVRNPLNGIMAIAEALFQDLGDKERFKPYVEHIRTQVERLSRLMEELLELGRPLGTSSMSRHPLMDICASAVDFWKEGSRKMRADVILEAPPGAAGMSVIGDEVKLQQVLVNLIDNAARYSPQGGEVRVAILGPDRGMHRVRVIDRGPGVPKQHLREVFDPFFTTNKRGTGLGLPIVKHIIESHGGEVKLWNNDPPPGCTVEVRLPVASVDF